MTREEARKLLPIIQAFAEGKRIEYGNGEDWSETETPTWSTDFDYRIKPEPKYRPFETFGECWNEMLRHEPFGWLKHKKSTDVVQIESINTGKEGKLYIEWRCACQVRENSAEIFDKFVFADGTPFGIKED